MTDSLKRPLKSALRQLGLEISRINPVATTGHRRLTMIKHLGIDTVLDVGANVGQFACALRESGYTGDIISFEPLGEAYEVLEKKASGDPNWRVFHTAIGAEDGESEINIARNSYSSSLLPMLDTHVRADPESRYLSTERVRVGTLDGALRDVLSNQNRLLLKIDTQGYETNVMLGAQATLRQVYLIECELSLIPLYEGQQLFQDMINRLEYLGFKPVHFEPAFSDRSTGFCLQIDGMFARQI